MVKNNIKFFKNKKVRINNTLNNKVITDTITKTSLLSLN